MLRRGEGDTGGMVGREGKRTGRMLSRGEGEVRKRRGRQRQGAAICQSSLTYPPPSNLRYSVCLFSVLI